MSLADLVKGLVAAGIVASVPSVKAQLLHTDPNASLVYSNEFNSSGNQGWTDGYVLNGAFNFNDTSSNANITLPDTFEVRARVWLGREDPLTQFRFQSLDTPVDSDSGYSGHQLRIWVDNTLNATNYTVPANEWHELAWVKRPGKMELYLDDTLKVSVNTQSHPRGPFRVSGFTGTQMDFFRLYTITGPTLHIENKPVNTVAVTWPTNASGFQLTSSTNLNGPYTSVTNVSVVNGTNYKVELLATKEAQFYRLQK